MLISEIPFKPQFSEGELAKAKGFFDKKEDTFGSVANYALVGTPVKNPEIYIYRQQNCHRAFGANNVKSPSLVATECGWRRNGKEKDTVRGFLDYVLSSYVGHVIVERDPEFILNNGFIVSLDFPAPFLQNLMIMTRHFYEIPARTFRLFDEAISGGLHPDVAYLLFFGSSFSTSIGDQGLNFPIAPHYGHRAHGLMNSRDMNLFIRRELGPFYSGSKKNYREDCDYAGGSAAFSNRPPIKDHGYISNYVGGLDTIIDDLHKDEDFVSELRTYRNGGSDVYRPPNPFVSSAKPLLKVGQVTQKEVLEVMIPWIKEKGIPGVESLRVKEPVLAEAA